MKERTVEQYLVSQVKKLRGEVRKVKWLDRIGAPDRLVMLPNRAVPRKNFLLGTESPNRRIAAERFLVELKAPGKKPDAAQLREHRRLRKFGWRVEVVDSCERVDQVLT